MQMVKNPAPSVWVCGWRTRALLQLRRQVMFEYRAMLNELVLSRPKEGLGPGQRGGGD